MKRKSLPANRSEGEPPSKRPRNSNSGYYCAVLCCSHRSTDTSLSFHRFPADGDRRKLWVAAIRRDVGRDFTITGNTRVCSSHFKERDFLTATSINTALVNRRLRTSAVPSVFSWSVPVKSRRTLSQITTTSCCGPITSAEKPELCTASGRTTTLADGSPILTPAPSRNHYFCVRTENGSYLNELLDEVSALRCDLNDTKGKLLSLENARKDPEKFKHLTGVPNYETFSVLWRYFERKARGLKWWRGMTTIRELYKPGGSVWRLHKTERKQLFAVLVRL